MLIPHLYFSLFFICSELLHPKDQLDPMKELLKKFYSSLGFHFVKPLEMEAYVHDIELLIVPCRFDLFEKALD